jgi:tRNA modification GTPase
MVVEQKSIYADCIIAPITSSQSKQRTALRISGEATPNLAKEIFDGLFKFTYNAKKYSFPIEIDAIKIDFEMSVFTMPKQCSFTHEPVMELHYPSNETLTVNILEFFYKKGVKPAEPGEFTKRAFLNGRLALSQANSIAALISAKTEEQRKKATKLLEGSEDDFIVHLKALLFEFRRNLEAVIDFPEEPDIDHKQFVWRDCIQKVETHLQGYHNKLHHDNSQSYAQILILGLANAGKSSLIKSLIPGSLPIISHIPGTTLDLIPYQLELEGHTVILYDSPGFKDAQNTLDEISLAQLKKRISSFDACIFLHTEENMEYDGWFTPDNFSAFINVRSKVDLLKPSEKTDALKISSLTGEGIDMLKGKILDYSVRHENEMQSPWMALEKRIVHLVNQKMNIIKARLTDADNEEELAAYDLDELLLELDELLYRDKNSEAILDSIFKNFCIGK